MPPSGTVEGFVGAAEGATSGFALAGAGALPPGAVDTGVSGTPAVCGVETPEFDRAARFDSAGPGTGPADPDVN